MRTNWRRVWICVHVRACRIHDHVCFFSLSSLSFRRFLCMSCYHSFQSFLFSPIFVIIQYFGDLSNWQSIRRTKSIFHTSQSRQAKIKSASRTRHMGYCSCDATLHGKNNSKLSLPSTMLGKYTKNRTGLSRLKSMNWNIHLNSF